MKKILYGNSHFPTLMQDDALYVDKTSFVEIMENLGERYLVFLRPRRFGKSLWISLLQHYYGVQYREKFPDLFGQLYIGQHPTPEANGFFILHFDFSAIDTSSPEGTFRGFLNNVHSGVSGFLSAYQTYFKPEQVDFILKKTTPNEMLSALFETCRNNSVPHPVYLLVDEYDHFANEVLAFRYPEFLEIVGKNGFIRKFYETVKIAAAAGIVRRLFITGVSPITMDSLTSGFNITTQLTTNLRFHDMMGFTTEQTAEVLRNVGATDAQLPALMEDMTLWYNGYRFNRKAETNLFNSDMVLYFASHFSYEKSYPDKMLDSNIASDYGKIRQIFRIGEKERDHRNVLEEVLTEGFTPVMLTDQFSFEKGFSEDDFKSLLFYMGYLTMQAKPLSETVLQIPNQVIRKLFWEYFAALTQETASINADHVTRALRDFTNRNDPMPLLKLVEQTLENLSNRDDMKLDEKHLKAIFVSYISATNAYLIKSEFETERKYVDLLLTGRMPFQVEHQFAIEFKYLHKKDAAKYEAIRTAAHQQLRDYLEHDDLKHLENLRSWVIVFVGTKLKVAEPLNG